MNVAQAIYEYQDPIIKKNFQDKLESLLRDSEKMKSAQPRTDATRHWAVVYTDLEKISAYLKTYLGE